MNFQRQVPVLSPKKILFDSTNTSTHSMSVARCWANKTILYSLLFHICMHLFGFDSQTDDHL